MSLSGKTVVITGASKGIGASAARLFAEAGANVALLARSADAIAELAGEIGQKALAIPCDVSRYWEIDNAFQTVLREFGSLDVLVNNAGVIDPITSIVESDPESWSHAIDINLKGVFNGVRAALPTMLAQKSGTILNVSSGAAHGPLEGWSAYCSGKAGAAMLTRCTHLEAGSAGIRVMGLSPGTVATEMQVKIKASGINPVSKLEVSDHIPPDWPAKALLWMCSAEADTYLGEEIALRDETIRAKVGLTS
ncbi:MULTISPECIES: SDR family oxidoreductase [Halocynthiibacter]|uniref:SDR family oxidoreductase n=1 Tax=Halocynthiibacter halioticoli TaxID=2986804 RepID=A0AAE3J0T8_9RHOB|nr:MULTISPECIES: SDR family oxidoreductase [Halocynthiibacter]MCV6825693.1 SDR family oxidoreductase [Halocynthiibacter halioticoli]MCW4058694.1 SDR family oxidoreductase [Halocynthiibacter sp. SDUM655004]